MILAKNMFVERVLPGSVLRKLADEEMAEYRRPFANPGEDRRPTLTWPRQIPIEGEPADVVAVVEDYSALARREPRSRSCSSTPTPARSWSAASASSAAPGPTRPRSPSRASTSSRRTAPTRSAARWRILCGRLGVGRAHICLYLFCQTMPPSAAVIRRRSMSNYQKGQTETATRKNPPCGRGSRGVRAMGATYSRWRKVGLLPVSPRPMARH